MIIPVTPGNAAPTLLKETGRIKACTRLEATERAGL